MRLRPSRLYRANQMRPTSRSRRQVGQLVADRLMLKRREGLIAFVVDEIKVVILLQKDGGVLRQLQQQEQSEARLVDVSQPLFTG